MVPVPCPQSSIQHASRCALQACSWWSVASNADRREQPNGFDMSLSLGIQSTLPLDRLDHHRSLVRLHERGFVGLLNPRRPMSADSREEPDFGSALDIEIPAFDPNGLAVHLESDAIRGVVVRLLQPTVTDRPDAAVLAP